LSAFAGVASAQSAVTIYGTFDGGLRNLTNTNAAGQSTFKMGSNGTYNSNRIGFKGVEDLGGGMNAHFALETGFNTGTGALDNANNQLFNRTATVGVGSAMGSVDLGRQYNVAFRTIAAYDPFAYKYTGIAYAIPATAGVRYNNDIQATGLFGAITARAEYALGEVVGNTSTGSAKAVGASYANGPVAVGAAYTDRDVAGQDNKHYTFGGAYQAMPALKVSAGYADEQQATTGVTLETKYSWVGASYAFTPALTATYAYYQIKVTGTAAQNAKKDLNLVGATYALSKRTNFYAALDMTKLDGAASTAIGGLKDQTGVSVGVNHAF